MAVAYDEANGLVHVVWEDVSDDDPVEPAVVKEIYLGLEYKSKGRGKYRPIYDGYTRVGYEETDPTFTELGDTGQNGFLEYVGVFEYDACGSAEAVLGDLSGLSLRLLTTLELQNEREFHLRSDADCD